MAGSPSRAVRSADKTKTIEERMMAGQAAQVPEALADRLRWGAVDQPETVGDLHAYPLKSPATVRTEQLTRLLMLRRDGVRTKKSYRYRAPYLDSYGAPSDARGAVTTALSFTNNQEEGPGAPLPQGALRVYDADRSGRRRYAGAASLPPTPKGKKVSVTLANAFDVTAEYRVTSSKQLSKRKVRRSVEVVLRSQRSGPVEVGVVQGFYSGWTITSASRPHSKPDASTALWTVPVPPGGSTRLTYTVDLSW
jgi:hypothetical protein